MIHYPSLNQQQITLMKEKQSYNINHRSLSMFHPLTQDISLENDKNYLFDLSYMSLISVSGDRGAEFLQGQLSCDVNQVTQDQMRQGIMCNLKGRILALLDVFSCQNNMYLALADDLVESTINSLAKTAQFSRVTLAKSKEFKLYGLYCQNPKDIWPHHLPLADSDYSMIQTPDFCAYHLGQGLYILVVSPQEENQVIKPFEEKEQYRSALAWQVLSLTLGRLNIYPETRGLFLPHRLGLHKQGYISFDKGCYKGQEIIARTHYKAKLKHELKLFKLSSDEIIFSGQKVFSEDGQSEIAELVDYAPLDDNHYLVALSILKDCSGKVKFEQHQHLSSIDSMIR